MLKMKMREAVRSALGILARKIRGYSRQGVKVKLTRKNLYISFPASSDGQFYILPRPGLSNPVGFSVKEQGDVFVLVVENPSGNMADEAQPSSLCRFQSRKHVSMQLGRFTTREEAQAVLGRINKLLTGNHLGKWVVRVFALWVVYMVATSFMQVESTRATAATDPSAFTVPGNPTPQAFPSVSADSGTANSGPGVPNSGDVSNFIYQQAMAAKAQATHQNMPPATDGDAPGLSGFGLDAGSPKGGCDPKLAFKVPKEN
jgi:hypothetical protein